MLTPTTTAAFALFLGSGAAPLLAANDLPSIISRLNIIPEVQSWRPMTGSLRFGCQWKVNASKTNPELRRLSLRVSQELSTACLSLASAASASTVVHLSLVNSSLLPQPEGYVLKVSGHVEIEASTPQGLFYGTQTLLQMVKTGHGRLPRGIVKDWPDYPMRGLMVDVARKYYSVAWLKQEIREMAYVKLNTLHLHLSDDKGFRLESHTHPELNRATSPLYSQAEIRDLVKFAQSYQVQIIPEIDLPAHANTILAAHPELRLVDKKGTINQDKIDLSMPGTYRLLKDLYEEFLPLFPGPFWHIGADEFLHPDEFANYPQFLTFAQEHFGFKATAIDTFLFYAKWSDDLLRSHGKRVRAWSDIYEYLAFTGQAVGLPKDISFNLWNKWSLPQDVVDHGYHIENANHTPLYYDLGIPYQGTKELVETWSPNRHFGGEGYVSIEPHNPNLDGAMFHIWSDPGDEAEGSILDHVRLPLRAMANRCWRSEGHTTVASFKVLADSLSSP